MTNLAVPWDTEPTGGQTLASEVVVMLLGFETREPSRRGLGRAAEQGHEGGSGDGSGGWGIVDHRRSECEGESQQGLREGHISLWVAWVAQSGKRPTSTQVMISHFVSSSPTSGSVPTARSLEPASDSVSPPFCPCPFPDHACALALSHKKKN